MLFLSRRFKHVTYCFKLRHCVFSKRINNYLPNGYLRTFQTYCESSNSFQHTTGLINAVEALTLPPSHIWSEFRLNPKGGPVRVSVGPSFVTHNFPIFVECSEAFLLQANILKYFVCKTLLPLTLSRGGCFDVFSSSHTRLKT